MNRWESICALLALATLAGCANGKAPTAAQAAGPSSSASAAPTPAVNGFPAGYSSQLRDGMSRCGGQNTCADDPSAVAMSQQVCQPFLADAQAVAAAVGVHDLAFSGKNAFTGLEGNGISYRDVTCFFSDAKPPDFVDEKLAVTVDLIEPGGTGMPAPCSTDYAGCTHLTAAGQQLAVDASDVNSVDYTLTLASGWGVGLDLLIGTPYKWTGAVNAPTVALVNKVAPALT